MRRLSALLTMLALGCLAEESLPVMHQRAFWWDKAGEISVNGQGVTFVPQAKKDGDANPLRFEWNAIQQLKLSESEIELVSYRDVLWQFGRDRQFQFALPKGSGGSFAAMEAVLRQGLGGRLVVALGKPAAGEAIWEIPAKLTGLFRGAEGALSFTGDELVFSTEQAGQSRRWPIAAIDAVAQTGPYEFSVTVPERALSDMGGRRSFQFQLKEALGEERYQTLWRAVERAHGTSLRFGKSQ